MTEYSEFRRLIEFYESQAGISETQKRLEILKGIKFYNWDDPSDTNTFNHIIGLPRKPGSDREYLLFDYEKLVIDKFEESKRVLVLKSTGLGISDLMLRRMAWLALSSNRYQGSQFCIITGPNINLAIGLIRRLKDLFLPQLNITFDSDQVTIILNQCTIRAFPSHHLDAMRSLTSPKFVLVDECDFLPPAESLKIRGVVERYIAKSDPYIALVSTPGQIGGLFQKILQEPENECIYSRLVLPYQIGLGKIYSAARNSGSQAIFCFCYRIRM